MLITRRSAPREVINLPLSSLDHLTLQMRFEKTMRRKLSNFLIVSAVNSRADLGRNLCEATLSVCDLGKRNPQLLNAGAKRLLRIMRSER